MFRVHREESLDKVLGVGGNTLLVGALKTPSSGALLGKSSSLIFPTGVETSHDGDTQVDQAKLRKINLLLDPCEAARSLFKKKLAPEKLGITATDIPLSIRRMGRRGRFVSTVSKFWMQRRHQIWSSVHF